MNSQNVGRRIENTIVAVESLTEDTGGFDGSKNGFPIEIKGCLKVHQNGSDYKRKPKTTVGRYWIDNNAHRILLERKGSYIFVIYEEREERAFITDYGYVKASKVNPYIGKGENTKIRWDRIFGVLTEGDMY